MLLAQIPQTARVAKKQVKAPEVEYTGAPEFTPIEQTTVSRAVNTDKDIIKVGDLYYMCFQGVWFMGRSPNGPWEVTGSVPGRDLRNPGQLARRYNVTNVTVVEDNSDAVVFATAAAYTGMMVGVGLRRLGQRLLLPALHRIRRLSTRYYRPYYPTYGYHASYNPWTGAYSRGVAAYGPYGGAGVGARYNPRTGTYARGAAAYGPYGARGAAAAYNPRTGTAAGTRQGSNVYGSWGQTGVQRGDQWASTVARHQQPDRHDHARDPGQRRRRRRHAQRPAGQRRRRANRQRRRLRRPRRQRLQEAGRQLAAVRQRQLEPSRSRAAQQRATSATDARRSATWTAQSRFGGARRRRAADARRQQQRRTRSGGSSSYRPSSGGGSRPARSAAAAAGAARRLQ